MFLVGMCDIFLILYLTTLSQVNPFHNSFLTVDDYNKLKEAKVKAEKDSEKSDTQILELKNVNSELDKQKDQAIQSALSAKAEIKKAMQLVAAEKERSTRADIKLSKVISEKDEFNKLLHESRESVQKTQIVVKELRAESEKAKEREKSTLNDMAEIQKEVEKVKKKELIALQIVKAVNLEVEKTREDEKKALEAAERLRLQAEEAKRREEHALKLAREAKLKAEEARKSEIEAKRVAEVEKLNAEKARKNEMVALDLAETANNQKEVALRNADMARKAEENALQVASVAQGETAKVKSKIQSIIQPADDAYNKNIIDKLLQFKITIDYKNRLKRVVNKVIIMKGLPVKIGDEYVFFVPLDQIGLAPSSMHNNYVAYNITVNGKPVTKLYVKTGVAKIAALVIGDEVEHCLPVGKSDKFSSYMPVLFSLRNQKLLGTMDRIRGISNDYFIIKRDHLLETTKDEFYFNNEGFRGTGNYAEYIVKGDQIVDLGGNFIGLAYKKNTILRIDNLKGWYTVSLYDKSVKQLTNHIYNINRL